MTERSSRPNIPTSQLVEWAACLAAPISIAWLIFRFSVNVAVQDQIRIGAFLVRNHGRFFPALADLFAQHNESRKVFPRLIFFYLAQLTNWNVKYEMAVSLLLACGAAVCIAVLARAQARVPVPNFAIAIAVLLLFSPVQWSNWLFGIQVVIFLPLFLLALGLVIAEKHPAIAALCALIATYSYANGMLLWLLLAPSLRRRRDVILWTLAAIVAIGFYFLGYHRPAESLPMDFSHPAKAIAFVFAFLGHPLAWSDSLAVNVAIGAIAIVLFAALARASLSWAALGMYSILSAAIAAVGRLGHGLQYAVEPRYTTFAIPLWIAIVMLASGRLRRGRAAGAMVLLALHGLAIATAWPKMRENYRDRLLARAATQFAFVLPDKSLFQRLVERDVPFALRVVSDLTKIGYVNPPPVGSDVVQRLDGGVTDGAFEGVLRLDHQLFLYGWARLPDGRAADAVLIARVAPDGDHLVALSERTVPRPNVPGMGWDLPATPKLAMPGATYRAWAYDTSIRRAYRLAGSVSVRSAARY